jgi:hypothetical protein
MVDDVHPAELLLGATLRSLPSPVTFTDGLRRATRAFLWVPVFSRPEGGRMDPLEADSSWTLFRSLQKGDAPLLNQSQIQILTQECVGEL